ncbi:hypothetical protein QLX52_18310 [Streptomyces albus]|uniref:hypothetical protein n=1 Tax=Streptomyces albus TaxID=1888 RepID=UPI0024AE29FA|nr:hypothetical protein [Streptomyces albus]MDI6410785.1 hypothetical protein [Streptomyces albus]
MPSVEEVQELLSSHLSGSIETNGLKMIVQSLEILEHERTFTAVFTVAVKDERWRVRIPSDRSDMHIFDGKPSPDLVTSIANMLRIQLVEWWFTKDRERQSARMGERLV